MQIANSQINSSIQNKNKQNNDENIDNDPSKISEQIEMKQQKSSIKQQENQHNHKDEQKIQKIVQVIQQKHADTSSLLKNHQPCQDQSKINQNHIQNIKQPNNANTLDLHEQPFKKYHKQADHKQQKSQQMIQNDVPRYYYSQNLTTSQQQKNKQIQVRYKNERRQIKKNQEEQNIEEIKRTLILQNINKKINQIIETQNPQKSNIKSAKFDFQKFENYNVSNPINSVDRLQFKKYSLMKQKQAQNKMMANVQFVKHLKGLNINEKNRKQWIQQTSQKNPILNQLKQTKRKYIQGLGFTSLSAQRLISNIPNTSRTTNHQSTNNRLPQIKNSKKKYHIFKPASFSLYTIQKRNQIFINKLAL